MRPLPTLLAALAALLLLLLALRPRTAAPSVVPAELDSAPIVEARERDASGILPAVPSPPAPGAKPTGVSPAREPAAARPRGPVAMAVQALAVRVADDHGAPVAGATVQARPRGWHWSDAVRTDAQGRVVLSVPSDRQVELRASARELLDDRTRLEPPLPATARLVLATTGPIRGTVRFADRERVGAGVEVRATAVGPGAPEVATALTDDRGDFAIEGLDAAVEHRLEAVARHLVCLEPRVVRPGPGRRRLEVGALFGAVVRLVEPDGSPIAAIRDLRSDTLYPPRRAKGAPVPVDPALAVAAGLPAELAEPRADRHLVLRAAPPTPTGELEPVEVTIDRPGYAPASASVAPRMLTAGLAETQLVLQPIACGALAIEALLPEPGVGDGALGPRVAVALKPETGGATRYWARLGDEPALVEGIPVGRYRARLGILAWSSQLATVDGLARLDIREGATARWTVDVRGSDYGMARFTQRTCGTVLVERDGGVSCWEVWFVEDAAVATTELLLPGEYLFVRGTYEHEYTADGSRTNLVALPGDPPPASSVASEHRVRFTVVAGETTVVDVPPGAR